MRIFNFYIILLFSCVSSAFSQINIWEGLDKHLNVKMTPYLVPGDDNKAIIVCPGGSYFWHSNETEGHAVARWLQKNGIASFVLNYRVAKFPAFVLPYRFLFRGTRYPDAQNDLRQTMRLIKKKAKEFGVNKDKIGAMGFSAGGHLVMSAVELFEKADRPNFLAMLYPVVTMDENCVHKRSRRALLGDNHKNNKELKNLLSMEKHIPLDCPPVFLVNCKDDPIVEYQNSILLDSALTINNINHKYILYNKGGHGFGVDHNKGTVECHQWEDEFLEWINNIEL